MEQIFGQETSAPLNETRPVYAYVPGDVLCIMCVDIGPGVLLGRAKEDMNAWWTEIPITYHGNHCHRANVQHFLVHSYPPTMESDTIEWCLDNPSGGNEVEYI